MKSKGPEFQAVYDQFRDKIRYYLGQLVNESEADDLTQEVFLKIHKGLDGFKGKSKLSTWVYRIATNTALDTLRSASFRHGKSALSVSGEAGESDMEIEDRDTHSGKKKPGVDEQVIKREMNACIREFIERLPPDYRTVIVLSELKDLKNREIAEILGVNLATVKIRLHRARARLKKEFEAGCTFYHDKDSGLSCDRKT